MESSAPNHEDHIAGKGFNSMPHQVHPDAQAMKILDAKVAVYQGWKKLETIPGGKVSQNSFD